MVRLAERAPEDLFKLAFERAFGIAPDAAHLDVFHRARAEDNHADLGYTSDFQRTVLNAAVRFRLQQMVTRERFPRELYGLLGRQIR